jgi:hypothetical protein
MDELIERWDPETETYVGDSPATLEVTVKLPIKIRKIQGQTVEFLINLVSIFCASGYRYLIVVFKYLDKTMPLFSQTLRYLIYFLKISGSRYLIQEYHNRNL